MTALLHRGRATLSKTEEILPTSDFRRSTTSIPTLDVMRSLPRTASCAWPNRHCFSLLSRVNHQVYLHLSQQCAGGDGRPPAAVAYHLTDATTPLLPLRVCVVTAPAAAVRTKGSLPTCALGIARSSELFNCTLTYIVDTWDVAAMQRCQEGTRAPNGWLRDPGALLTWVHGCQLQWMVCVTVDSWTSMSVCTSPRADNLTAPHVLQQWQRQREGHVRRRLIHSVGVSSRHPQRGGRAGPAGRRQRGPPG